MDIDFLLARHESLVEELSDAISADDLSRVKELDKMLLDNWEQLIAFEPPNSREILLLLNFLLDQLLIQLDQDGISKQITRKIQQLFLTKSPDRRVLHHEYFGQSLAL